MKPGGGKLSIFNGFSKAFGKEGSRVRRAFQSQNFWPGKEDIRTEDSLRLGAWLGGNSLMNRPNTYQYSQE